MEGESDGVFPIQKRIEVKLRASLKVEHFVSPLEADSEIIAPVCMNLDRHLAYGMGRSGYRRHFRQLRIFLCRHHRFP